MTTSSDRYSGETGLARINGVIDYLLELQGEVDNDERQHLEIMIADLRQAVMCVRAAEYRAKYAVEERDELQKWKDAHNTFWRDRAERRDAMREGEKKQ